MGFFGGNKRKAIGRTMAGISIASTLYTGSGPQSPSQTNNNYAKASYNATKRASDRSLEASRAANSRNNSSQRK